jgi:hypothetical protein
MSRLLVYDGAKFGMDMSLIDPAKMTIVLTHGWYGIGFCPNSNVASTPFSTDVQTDWTVTMANQLAAEGITKEIANIVAWDWRYASMGCMLPPEENTPGQGESLGKDLQAVLGTSYAQPIHFLGHSLGTLVNAAAANYVHGDTTAQQDVSSNPWAGLPMHMTLFDEAEVASLASQQARFDGITVGLISGSAPAGIFVYGLEALQGWKDPLPVHFAWADNYVSLVGVYKQNAVNVSLEKTLGWLDPVSSHGYPIVWYGMSIANPTDVLDPLGFQNSYEYEVLQKLSFATFLPSISDIELGSVYDQTVTTADPLALKKLGGGEIVENVQVLFDSAANIVVQTANGAVQVAGNVTVGIEDAAQSAGQATAAGFTYVANQASRGGQAIVNLFDTSVLHLTLASAPPASPSPGPLSVGGSPHQLNGTGASNSPPMAWIPLSIPSNSPAMAFDFIVSGPPAEDSLVCGIGETNLFSLQAKYIPTNAISASRLIDVSPWMGQQVELFFGLMGGTSTNCALQVENIRFFTLAPPTLSLAQTNGVTMLFWPNTVNGYALESATDSTLSSWSTVTNVPALFGGQFMVTNTWTDQVRFFRLRGN